MAEFKYAHQELTREEVDAWQEPAVIEFGANWCEHCQAAQTPFRQAIVGYEHLRHVKVEDGRGRALGRSFRVKLWPTFIFLNAGVEQARLVRPETSEQIRSELERITTN